MHDTRIIATKVEPPKLVATVQYNDASIKTPSGKNYLVLPGVFIRSAQSRTIYLVNQLGVAITSLDMFVFDSSLPSAVQPAAGTAFTLAGDTYSDTNGVASSSVSTLHTKKHPELSVYGDSLAIAIGIGATLPTSGTFSVYVSHGMGA